MSDDDSQLRHVTVTFSSFGLSYLTTMVQIGRVHTGTTYYKNQADYVLKEELGPALAAGADSDGRFELTMKDSDWFFVMDTLRVMKRDVADYDEFSKMLRRMAESLWTYLASDTEVGEL